MRLADRLRALDDRVIGRSVRPGLRPPWADRQEARVWLGVGVPVFVALLVLFLIAAPDDGHTVVLIAAVPALLAANGALGLFRWRRQRRR